jgi:tyrosyl-tRNA synthetase
MESFQLRPELTLLDLMMEASLAPSKSQARRLIDQNAVRLDGETLTDPYELIELEAPAVLQVGKRRFRQLLPAS